MARRIRLWYDVQMLLPPSQPRPELEALIEKARHHVMTPREKWLQRVSFVYGNGSLDNPRITYESVYKTCEAEYGPCPD